MKRQLKITSVKPAIFGTRYTRVEYEYAGLQFKTYVEDKDASDWPEEFNLRLDLLRKRKNNWSHRKININYNLVLGEIARLRLYQYIFENDYSLMIG